MSRSAFPPAQEGNPSGKAEEGPEELYFCHSPHNPEAKAGPRPISGVSCDGDNTLCNLDFSKKWEL